VTLWKKWRAASRRMRLFEVWSRPALQDREGKAGQVRHDMAFLIHALLIPQLICRWSGRNDVEGRRHRPRNSIRLTMATKCNGTGWT